MPQRSYNRGQIFLLPPSLEEVTPDDHPARFVADLLDSFDASTWSMMGIDLQPALKGEKRYAPQALLAIWVYGFMKGIRSTRKLEEACREQIPFLWLSGNQTPDHNTLARFYQQHPQAMREVFRQTVQVAVQAGLVDWALQVGDGTKIAANASGRKTLNAGELAALMERVERAIDDLEAQQVTGGEDGPPALPPALHNLQARRERIAAALAVVRQKKTPTQANVTDPDAHLMASGPKQTILPAYNAQAVVCAIPGSGDGPSGRVIVAAMVRTTAHDHQVLAPLIDQATAMTGRQAELTVADGGYYSGRTLAACAARGAAVVVPNQSRRSAANPYHHTNFRYDHEHDSFTCPADQTLRFGGTTVGRDGVPIHRYRSDPAACRSCAAMGTCTTNQRHGRMLAIRSDEPELDAHRRWMETEAAQQASRRRGSVIEAVFGTIKEQFGGRRFLHRGHQLVEAEWSLLAAAQNLRTLWRWTTGAYGTGPGTLPATG